MYPFFFFFRMRLVDIVHAWHGGSMRNYNTNHTSHRGSMNRRTFVVWEAAWLGSWESSVCSPAGKGVPSLVGRIYCVNVHEHVSSEEYIPLFCIGGLHNGILCCMSGATLGSQLSYKLRQCEYMSEPARASVCNRLVGWVRAHC